jgi:hypothetical protein
MSNRIGIVMGGYLNISGSLMSKSELNDEISAIQKENKLMREFIEDCSVSHTESRYKYRAQVIINKLNSEKGTTV